MRSLRRRGQTTVGLSHVHVALHRGGHAVHQLIEDMDHPVGRHQVSLDDVAFLPAAVDPDVGLSFLEPNRKEKNFVETCPSETFSHIWTPQGSVTHRGVHLG